jgi:nucleotide-binding universal stress UspA family protein
MSYKVILVHADKAGNAKQRIRIAADLAEQFNAHLIGAALTAALPFVYPGGWAIDGPAYSAWLSSQTGTLEEQAQQSLEAFAEYARVQNIRSFETVLIDDDPGEGLNLRAHYSDLVVMEQTDPARPKLATPPDLPEYVIMGSGRPVLLVPFAGTFKTVGKRPLVAWDGSMSATRAVTGALPLLGAADNVDVVVFTGDKNDILGETPGDDVALYLSRHDVKTNVIRSDDSIADGNPLLQMARDRGNDLIVMGGYGHSRLRELVMGGVTRTVLRLMTEPVLMAH